MTETDEKVCSSTRTGIHPATIAIVGVAFCLVLAAVLPPLERAAGQTPVPTSSPQDWTVSIGQFDASKYPEVTLYLNITDTLGNPVEGLKREDFVVSEDGKVVEVSGYAGVGEKRLVDIVYVFDTTASMTEEIAGVVATSLQFADQLQEKGRDYRLGLVTFGDEVLQVQRPDNSLTQGASEFKGWVSNLVASGGDLEPENDYAALYRALDMNFRPDAQIVFILITDAPPHRFGDPIDNGIEFKDPNLDLGPVTAALKAKGASVYAIAPDLEAFRKLAEETGGRFYDIKQNPDFTNLIATVGTTLANQYRLTYRSPRPTYDGTRRNVQVFVGGKTAGDIYAEPHLLTVRSNCLVGLVCLLPLLFALAAPAAIRTGMRLAGTENRSGMGGDDRVAPPGSLLPPAPGVGTIQAGQSPELRVDSPRPTEKSPDPGSELAPVRCPNCGQTLRIGARFCNKCGIRL